MTNDEIGRDCYGRLFTKEFKKYVEEQL